MYVCMYETGEACDSDGRCDVRIQSYQKCPRNRPFWVSGIDGNISKCKFIPTNVLLLLKMFLLYKTLFIQKHLTRRHTGTWYTQHRNHRSTRKCLKHFVNFYVNFTAFVHICILINLVIFYIFSQEQTSTS
jgi:hypothetical protein